MWVLSAPRGGWWVQCLPILWSHVLSGARVSYTSNIPQHDIRNYSHLCIRRWMGTLNHGCYFWQPSCEHSHNIPDPDPCADPKSRSTLGFCNLHHWSIRTQNWGICILGSSRCGEKTSLHSFYRPGAKLPAPQFAYTCKVPKMMNPMLPVLFILGYWASFWAR